MTATGFDGLVSHWMQVVLILLLSTVLQQLPPANVHGLRTEAEKGVAHRDRRAAAYPSFCVSLQTSHAQSLVKFSPPNWVAFCIRSTKEQSE